MTWGPGAAFIQWTHPFQARLMIDLDPGPIMRHIARVPDGYVWTPATISTAAGWVRPMGQQDARHE